MKWFTGKNKLVWDITATVVFIANAVLHVIEYNGDEGKNMDLVVAIVFGVFGVVKLVDVLEYLKNRKRLKEGEMS